MPTYLGGTDGVGGVGRWRRHSRARRPVVMQSIAGRQQSVFRTGLRVQGWSTHQPAKAASRPKSMPAFAGAASGLAATSCCAGERLATRLSTAPPRRRSAGRAAVSLREQRWRGCAHTGLLTMAGACVHEGAGLLGGGAGGECENGDNAEHLSEVAAGTEGGGATKRGEIKRRPVRGVAAAELILCASKKAAPAATASLPETYTGSIKRSVNASKTHEGEQNDGGPAGHMAGGRARGWGGGRRLGRGGASAPPTVCASTWHTARPVASNTRPALSEAHAVHTITLLCPACQPPTSWGGDTATTPGFSS